MKIYLSLHDRLKTQLLTLPEIIRVQSTEDFNIAPTPESWSIRDNIAHLAKYQITFLERIHKILNENAPYFYRYKANDDPYFPAFRKQTVEELITSLSDQRLTLITLVLGLPASSLERIGIHEKYGSLDIIQWLEFFLLHEAHHLFTIFQLIHSKPAE